MDSDLIINEGLDSRQLCEKIDSLETKVRNWESMLQAKSDQVI